jgi:hypothetical protein
MLVDSGEINEAKFFGVVENFYKTSLEYVNKWKCSLGNTDKFKWVLLRRHLKGKKYRTAKMRNSRHSQKQKKLVYSISGPS